MDACWTVFNYYFSIASKNCVQSEKKSRSQGRNQGRAKGAEALPLAKLKLRKNIKYRIVLTFPCLGDLKLRGLAN